jgi:hypothetical protein
MDEAEVDQTHIHERVIRPADGDAAIAMKPSIRSLDQPPPPVAPQSAAGACGRARSGWCGVILAGTSPSASTSSRSGRQSCPLSAITGVPSGTSSGMSLAAGISNAGSPTWAAAATRPKGNHAGAGRRPPVSSPCPPWFCRHGPPFFGADEGRVGP